MEGTLVFIIITLSLDIVLSSMYRPDGTKISDYDNYLEDQSLIGKEISCTNAEKECFKFDRVLHSDGKCYVLSHLGPCGSSVLFYDREKAQKGEYKTGCFPLYKCGNANERLMAYDQTCYQASLVNEVCDWKRNLTYSFDFFGDGHCRCYGDSCPSRPIVTQPVKPGRCRFPDLIKPMFPYLQDPLAYKIFPCSSHEHECFKQGKMLHSDGSCYPILQQGPCEEGQIFVANKTTFLQYGWLVSMCGALSCDQGYRASERQVRFQEDGKCYRYTDVENKLCPPHGVLFDVFGEAGCGFKELDDVSAPLPMQLTGTGECMGLYGPA